MNIYDFISQEQLDNLPHDPRVAFVEFTKHCLEKLEIFSEKWDLNEQHGWHEYENARFSMMGILIAAAKRFDIEPFKDMEVPLLSEKNSNQPNQFIADLNYYITQIILDNTIKQRSDSVGLSQKSKDRIRQHLNGLKDCIDKSELDDSRKSSLQKKIIEFENELEKSRLNLLQLSWITCQIMAVPGAMWASAEIVNKLVSNISQTVAVEKSIEDEDRKLPSRTENKKLFPPRNQKQIENKKSDWGDLDDNVPF